MVWRIFTREGLRELAVEAIRVWLWPPLLAGITIVIGHLEGVSWFYISIGATIVFAAVSSGLLRFDEWCDRRRIEGKLVFEQVNVGRDIRGSGIVIGIQLQSLAGFPLEFETTEMRTRLADKVPTPDHKPLKLTIPTAGKGWYNDNAIELDNPPCPGTIEGLIEFRVKYGLPGTPLKYSLRGKKQVVASFNDDGLLIDGRWNDAV